MQVKETEGLKICGAADLVLGDGRLALHTPDTGQSITSCLGTTCTCIWVYCLMPWYYMYLGRLT